MSIKSIPNKKSLIEKIKHCCTAISKFNLNSPCLLQFVRINGEYEVIITHDPINGDRFDFYKIFSTVTRDSFYISEEDENISTDKTNLMWYSHLKYDMCIDSFYCFPKFVLKAIKEEQIYDFEVLQRSYTGPLFLFNMDIIYNDKDEKYKNTLFIRNSEKLDYLYNLYILPLGFRRNRVSDIFLNYNKECCSYLILDPNIWEDSFNKNKIIGAMKLNGANNEPFTIYHNDFMQKKIVNGTITKRFESPLGNIATLYFNIELPHNVYEYFMYKYYDI